MSFSLRREAARTKARWNGLMFLSGSGTHARGVPPQSCMCEIQHKQLPRLQANLQVVVELIEYSLVLVVRRRYKTVYIEVWVNLE